MNESPSVDVIIPSLNGRDHLALLLPTLATLDYPTDQLDLVVVDNASVDGTAEWLAAEWPMVRVLRAERNLGFAAACNWGARASSSEYVAFLNNDMRVEPGWLRGLLAPISDQVVCSGGTILTWDGRRVDFVEGALNWYGRAFQRDQGLPYRAERYAAPRPLPFACGGSLLVHRETFRKVGGFDDDFFAYFEDVDFGWRLWILGHQVWFAPESVAYHRLHATGAQLGMARRTALSERNALWTMIKNLEQPTLDRLLPGALLLQTERALGLAALLPAEIEAAEGPLSVEARAAAIWAAQEEALAALPTIERKRAEIQARRALSDAEFFARFPPVHHNPIFPGRAHNLNERRFWAGAGLDPKGDGGGGSARQRLLILCHEKLGPKLAGPAIRALEIGRALADEADVLLAARAVEPGWEAPPGVAVYTWSPGEAGLRPLLATADVVLALGQLVSDLPELQDLGTPLIVDWYDPFALECLTQVAQVPAEVRPRVELLNQESLAIQARSGDFYLAASERQRDFWLGVLLAHGRVGYTTTGGDPELRDLLGVVPFGLPAQPPCHDEPVLKGVVPGIAPDDAVLFWGGGLWQWFDPATLLRALARVVAVRPTVKLFFAAGAHHAPEIVAPMPVQEETRALAAELGLLDRHVFFGDWIPYDRRGAYLLEADLAVSLHCAGLETHFASRTRLLDAIWAGLPLVVTAGDPLGDLVATHGLGRVVPPGDADAVAEAILELLGQPGLRGRLAPAFAAVRPQFEWDHVVEPLRRWLRHPRLAADIVVPPGGGRRLVDARAQILDRLDQLQSEVEGLRRHIAGQDERLRTQHDLLQAQQARLDAQDEALRGQHAAIQERDELLQQIAAGRVMRLMNAISGLTRKSSR